MQDYVSINNKIILWLCCSNLPHWAKRWHEKKVDSLGRAEIISASSASKLTGTLFSITYRCTMLSFYHVSYLNHNRDCSVSSGVYSPFLVKTELSVKDKAGFGQQKSDSIENMTQEQTTHHLIFYRTEFDYFPSSYLLT